LLGPLGSLRYQHSHSIKRTLSPQDVSSVLFQDNTELQIPFRTQFILAQNRREEMVNRLFYLDGSGQNKKSDIVMPFILPSLLNSKQTITNNYGKDEYVPAFGTKDILVISLLQQLQTINFDQKYQKSRQNLHDRKLSTIHSSFDLLGDHQPDVLSLENQEFLLNDYKSHLMRLFSPENLQSNFISSDLGSTSPLYRNGGLERLDQLVERLPVILKVIEGDLKDFNGEEGRILGQFFKNQNYWKNLDELNSFIKKDLLGEKFELILKSHQLLKNTLQDPGSTGYIDTPEQYNFWLEFLGMDVGVMYRNYQNDQKNDQKNNFAPKSVYSIQESISNPENAVLAYHPYYLWESYSLPIIKPSKEGIEKFYLTQFSRIFEAQKIKNEQNNNKNENQISTTQISPMKFFEEYINIEFDFTSPLDIINNSSDGLNNSLKFKIEEEKKDEKIIKILNLFLQNQNLNGKNCEENLNLNLILDQKIRQILPKLEMNLYYPQHFYTKSQQEELLIQNIDISGIVDVNIHSTMLMALKIGQFGAEMNTVIQSHFEQIAQKINIESVENIEDIKNSKKFQNFINDTILRIYLESPLDYININILHSNWLVTILEERRELFLDDDQNNNVEIFSEDLQFNQNQKLWLFQIILRSFLQNNSHNKNKLPKNTQNESKLNNFLTSIGSYSHSLAATSTNPITPQFKAQFKNTSQTTQTTQTPQNSPLLTPFQTYTADSCSECKAQETIEFNKVIEEFPKVIESLEEWACVKLWPAIAPYFGKNMCDPTIPGECYQLCSGMLHVYKDSIGEMLAFLQHDPQRTCFKKGSCPYNPDDEVPQFPQQVVTSAGGDEGIVRQIFHITDVHWDHLYSTEEGSRVRCKMPVCCYKTNTTINDVYGIAGALFELDHYSDGEKSDKNNDKKQNLSKFNPKSSRSDTPRPFGEYLCDAPEQLVKSSVEQILLHCPDFGIFTGDAPAHDLWRQNQVDNMNAVRFVTSSIGDKLATCKKMFDLRKKVYKIEQSTKKKINMFDVINNNDDLEYRFAVLWEHLSEKERNDIYLTDQLRDPNFVPEFYPSIGNHLYSPVNHFAGIAGFDDWFLQPLADLWSAFIKDKSSLATVRFGGFYVKQAGPNMFIISLHTGLLDKHNPWRMLNLGHWDPSGQGHFLENILTQIRNVKGKAILIMHEPHGDLIKGPASEYYFYIYKKFAGTVISDTILAGHEHHDFTRTLHRDFPVNMTSIDYLKGRLFHENLQLPYIKNEFFGREFFMKSNEEIELNNIDNLFRKNQFYFYYQNNHNHNNNNNNPFSNLTPMLLELLPGSITPANYENNPSFRVLTMKNREIIDYSQYVFDISLQESTPPTSQWVRKYVASELYKINLFSAVNWRDMVVNNAKNDRFWDQYTLRYWGYIPLEMDPEFQEERWTPLQALCSTLTRSDAETEYCIIHWKD
jgi:hypothetical protein